MNITFITKANWEAFIAGVIAQHPQTNKAHLLFQYSHRHHVLRSDFQLTQTIGSVNGTHIELKVIRMGDNHDNYVHIPIDWLDEVESPLVEDLEKGDVVIFCDIDEKFPFRYLGFFTKQDEALSEFVGACGDKDVHVHGMRIFDIELSDRQKGFITFDCTATWEKLLEKNSQGAGDDSCPYSIFLENAPDNYREVAMLCSLYTHLPWTTYRETCKDLVIPSADVMEGVDHFDFDLSRYSLKEGAVDQPKDQRALNYRKCLILGIPLPDEDVQYWEKFDTDMISGSLYDHDRRWFLKIYEEMP